MLDRQTVHNLVQNNHQQQDRSELTVGSGGQKGFVERTQANRRYINDIPPETHSLLDDIAHYKEKQKQDRGFVRTALSRAVEPITNVWHQRKISVERQPEGHLRSYDARGEYIPQNKHLRPSLRSVAEQRMAQFGDRLNEVTGRAIRGAISGLQKGAENQSANVHEALAEDISEPKKESTVDRVPEETTETSDYRERVRAGLRHAETRGRSSEEAYKAKSDIAHKDGTHDWGKYQVNENTFKEWGKAWLGEDLTVEKWLSRPDLQEQFLEEFLSVAERYDLSEDEAALVWHNGWGVLGKNAPFEEKKRKLQSQIEKYRQKESRTEKKGQRTYLESFREGIRNAYETTTD